MSDPLPLIACHPHARVNGANKLTDASPLMSLIELEDALHEDFTTDVHAVLYVVADPVGSVHPFPRINKPCLPEIIEAGFNVFLTCIGIDVDSPGHVVLTAETHADLDSLVFGALRDAPEKYAYLSDFTAYYTTRGGMRFLYVLKDPIPVLEAEQYILGVIKGFKDIGIPINELECKDWTRLFRLPRATRESNLLGHRPFDEIILHRDIRLDAKALVTPVRSGDIDKKTGVAKMPAEAVMPLHQQMPDDLCYADLCQQFTLKGKEVPSAFYKAAKKQMKGRLSYGCLFNGEILAHAGQRDSNIQRFVGEACTLLVNMPGCSPEHIYALFLPSISVLPEDEDPNHPGWRAVCWKAICRYWPREVHKQQIAAKMEDETWESVVNGLRSWDKSPDLYSEHPHAVQSHVLRRGILATANQYFILQANGRYETTPTDRHHLIARIRELGMDKVLQTWSLTNKGQEDRSIQGMLNANVASGFEINGVVTDNECDGTIENKTLTRTLFRRRPDLEPEENADVDRWLRVFGGDQYEKLCHWIGLALAWDEGPICALSVKGPPGCGKKLLVQGLVECTNTGKMSDATEFGRFKSGIIHSPFLVVNEGFPSPQNMPLPPSDAFRSFVGGDPIRIEEKYKVPITVRNPLRIIFTTNNDDVIRALAGGRDLTPYDRDAIAQRLFHIDVREAASRWLLDMGGLKFTRGWISGDAGSKSSYVVARHFLYLHATRPVVPAGSRFLMEGSNNERLIKAMTLRSGAAPAVFEVLTRLIELAGKPGGNAVIQPSDIPGNLPGIYVTENMVEKYEQREFPGRQTNHHVIKNVLAAMRKPGSEPRARVMGNGQDRHLAVWHELNGPLILEEAIERGLPCMQLQKVLGYVPEGLPLVEETKRTTYALGRK